MDIFRSPAMTDPKGSAWDRIENHVKEERPLQPVRKILVKGSVDVVFRRFDKPVLIVAGETADAVASVKTYFNGGKLVIEREGMSISTGYGRMVFHGTVGSFVMGDISAYGQVAHLDVEIASSGDVDASELIADHASLSIAGSGDIGAFVRSEVRARVAGSGDIVVRGDPPRRDHSVAGSGKIKFR